MKPFRKPIALVALFALLFGNAAGWTHVGCSAHSAQVCGHGECCSAGIAGHGDPVATAQPEAAAKPKAAARRGAAGHHHGCACRGHSHHVGTVAGDDCRDTSGSEDSPEPCPHHHPPTPHDPAHCSICQSFFESRDAVTFELGPPNIVVMIVDRDGFPQNDVLFSHLPKNLQRARGPPSV
ncbi:MAG: hypothetical protein AAF958_04470 [Planctomycetota bacterium]